jgi:hypothetical protein
MAAGLLFFGPRASGDPESFIDTRRAVSYAIATTPRSTHHDNLFASQQSGGVNEIAITCAIPVRQLINRVFR